MSINLRIVIMSVQGPRRSLGVLGRVWSGMDGRKRLDGSVGFEMTHRLQLGSSWCIGLCC